MGQECNCTLRRGGRSFTGRAQLETDFLLFRGGERLKVPLKDLTSVAANGGVLTLQFPGGPATLELGAQAEKWADKILHPPTLLEKLGVKPGLAIGLEGEFDQDFQDQLGPPVKAKADLLFYAASKTSDLARIPRLISKLKPGGAIWIVYPKGVSAIREAEVIAVGRAAGLKDTKVARFSDTHTALRFSISKDTGKR
ncbi:MAG: hypothetical protein WBY44_16475 [Bryobacteraceae bacterium]|jgi:hypothetical protein